MVYDNTAGAQVGMNCLSRVDIRGREESIERAIWPVKDVFGKSCARNSYIDQS